MNRQLSALFGAVLGICIVVPAQAADLKLRAAVRMSARNSRSIRTPPKPMRSVTLPPTGTCKPLVKNGLPIPDPQCSPGAINPTLTLAVLKAKDFTTKCVRDQASVGDREAEDLCWYKIKKPLHNTGSTQVCELDHVIFARARRRGHAGEPVAAMRADQAALNKRFFKQKDAVENFLNREVKAGRIDLATAQQGIAEDWTQFLAAARKAGVK